MWYLTRLGRPLPPPFAFEWTTLSPIYSRLRIPAEGHRSCKSGMEFDTILLSSSCAKFRAVHRAKLTRWVSFEQIQRRRWIFWKSLSRDCIRLGLDFLIKNSIFLRYRGVSRLDSNRKDMVWILKIILIVFFAKLG